VPSHGFVLMFIARMFVGIAAGGALPAALSLAADLTNRAVRGKIIALLSIGQLLGAAGAFVLVGRVLAFLPTKYAPGLGLEPMVAWRLLLLLFSLGLGTLALALFLLREPPPQEISGAQVAGVRAMLVELAAYRRILLPVVIGSVTVSMADAAASIWAVPVLTRFLHLQPRDFGGWMGLLFMVTGFCGVVLGGFLADLGQRLGGRAGLLRAAAVVAALATPMAFFPMMATVEGFAALLGLLLLLGSGASVISLAAITLLIPNRLRGVSISLIVAVNFLFGLGVAPTLVSFLTQVMGYGSDIRIPLTMLGLVAGLASLGAFLVAIRTARRSADI
jgi:MFS family permease